jgi:hypothetical protein
MNTIFNVGVTLLLVWQSTLYIAYAAKAASPIQSPLVQSQKRDTTVSIVADRFLINGLSS